MTNYEFQKNRYLAKFSYVDLNLNTGGVEGKPLLIKQSFKKQGINPLLNITSQEKSIMLTQEEFKAMGLTSEELVAMPAQQRLERLTVVMKMSELSETLELFPFYVSFLQEDILKGCISKTKT